MDVIVVQPGVVRTDLARKTIESVGSQVARKDSPYSAQLARFLDFLVQNAEETDVAATTPDDVARVIVQAAMDTHPATRYKIGEEAKRLTALRHQLSDQEWDAIYRKLYG